MLENPEYNMHDRKELHMPENKRSWLKINKIQIVPQITLKIPTVGEILDNERSYYGLVSMFTATPFQYMVPLDDMGIDYTSIDDWGLFKLLFCSLSKQIGDMEQQILKFNDDLQCCRPDTSEYKKICFEIQKLNQTISETGIDMVFDGFRIFGFELYIDKVTGEEILYNPSTGVQIDRLIHKDLTDAIRKINLFEKVKYKPGNEHMKKYLLQKERKRQKRNAKKPYEPYLEKLVIALVNTSEFSYKYEECMDLSIYNFNQSLKQIQHKINFDNTMLGIYTGSIDATKIGDKHCMSWIQNKA